LVHLKGLHCLTTLRLEHAAVTAVGLSRLAGLTSLESLNLDSAEKITDPWLVHLRGLSNLQTLGLAEFLVERRFSVPDEALG
jgi:hypothetical protein